MPVSESAQVAIQQRDQGSEYLSITLAPSGQQIADDRWVRHAPPSPKLVSKNTHKLLFS
jgi:hypothetical protein